MTYRESAQKPATDSAASELDEFVAAILGKPVLHSSGPSPEDCAPSELDEFVAAIRGEPIFHARGRILDETAEAELSEFVRGITTLREYNPNQPRDNIGRWSGTGGGAPNPDDPSHWYLPSDSKGTWSGAKGNSTFHPHKSAMSGGERVTGIEFRDGLPVLDEHAIKGHTATIVITGHNATDQRNALAAWKKTHPGQELPLDTVFHHDLRHTAEATAVINGKKTKVVVGEMRLIPKDVHELVYHEGSASVARKVYGGLKTNVQGVADLAEKQAALAGKEGTLVAKTAKKIVPGKIPKSLRGFIGRNVLRALPIIGTGLAILEFSDNVEAHGVGGAALRAVPVLGDLISAHDLGSDLAKQIRDDANADSDANLRAINDPVDAAYDKASQQTIEAFNELAPQIQVTNPYSPDGRVDPDLVVEALKIYRGAMQAANLMVARGRKDFSFPAAAARAKQELKERLTRISQKQPPRQPGGNL